MCSVYSLLASLLVYVHIFARYTKTGKTDHFTVCYCTAFLGCSVFMPCNLLAITEGRPVFQDAWS